MYLTYIGAAERPHRDVRAGSIEALVATPWRACQPSLARQRSFRHTRPRHPWRGARRDEDTLSVFVYFRLALLILLILSI
jgi:hypothetical protein